LRLGEHDRSVLPEDPFCALQDRLLHPLDVQFENGNGPAHHVVKWADLKRLVDRSRLVQRAVESHLVFARQVVRDPSGYVTL